MAVPIQNLRSGVASKRPVATGLAVGEIAINYNEEDPAIYLRGNADALVKVAPVYVATGAPNTTPASGGASGNTIGEQWLDKSVTPPIQKVWDGSAWVPSFAVGSGTITSTEIADGTITNGDINASAAIAFSKLATGALPSAITVNSSNIVDGSIVNADINASAAIDLSKLNTGALPSAITVNSSNIVNGSIVDEDISASAGITLTKLANGALPNGITVSSTNITDGTIVNADINASAAIALSKLATGALPNGITVSSTNIVDNTIVNADINSAAAIGLSKLATGALPVGITVTSGNVADSSILTSASIGSTVQAYDADTAKLDVAQTFTAQQTFGELKETVFTLGTSGSIALDPANGSFQSSVLTGAIAFTDSLESGQAVVLQLEGGASFTVTWPTITWVTGSGNAAPTLTAKDTLVFWKVSTTLYGAYVGSYV